MKLVIHNPDQSQIILTDIKKGTTLGDVLIRAEICRNDIVIFTGKPGDTNATPLVKHELALEEYNLWFDNENVTVDISIYYKDDTESYNYERYKMYSNLW